MSVIEYAPFDYGDITVGANTYQPSTSKSFNNLDYIYWERALFQRAASSMIFTLPEEWKGKTKDFFQYILFRFGYMAVFSKAEYGTIFQPCSLSGQDLYYQPVRALVSNPALPSGEDLTIGKDCEILKLSPDYLGIWDVVSYHAEKLALLDAAANMSAINSKVAYVLGAKTKGAANALKKIFDKVNDGQTTVIYDNIIENDGSLDSEPFVAFDRKNIKESYLVDQILEDMRTVINNFDCEIGIPVLPQEKKERMITDEANGRIIDGMSRAIIWEETFNSSAEEVNKMFGTNIKVDLRYKEVLKKTREDGDDNGTRKTDNSGSL